MKIFIHIGWLSFIFPAFGFCAAVADTIPPSYSWISPAPFSVITTNSIRLSVDARDDSSGSGIQRVAFIARYTDFSGKKVQKDLGQADTYPYEVIWNCADIADQCLGKLKLYCMVTDKAGNASDTKTLEQQVSQKVVIDRNPGNSTLQLSCYRAGKEIILDGNLKEWESLNGITCVNNDNTVTCYSMWDDANLYFAARVRDKSVISTISSTSEKIEGMAQEDVVEIFLDIDHNHDAFFVLPDRHFLFSAAGKVYETFTRRDQQHQEVENAFPRVLLRTSIHGTLNKDTDIDHGYSIEASVSWKELGIIPRKGRTIGLEVWNTDRDYLRGTGTFAGWTTNVANLKNPSEWGNLVLEGESIFPRSALLLLPALFLLASTGLFYRYKKRKLRRVGEQDSSIPPEEPEEKAFIRKAKEFTLEHFSDDTLDREAVAAHVGLNPAYFGKVFNKETSVHYSEYLTELRIEKAKELLLLTSKNVTEIAYETGFSSQSYFSTVFKRKTGLTPKQYMNKKH
jgi:AraC-like DNA-binding protein